MVLSFLIFNREALPLRGHCAVAAQAVGGGARAAVVVASGCRGLGIAAAAVALEMIQGGVMQQGNQARATRQDQEVQVLVAQQRSLSGSSR